MKEFLDSYNMSFIPSGIIDIDFILKFLNKIDNKKEIIKLTNMQDV